jgi:hypothetical protein
MEVVELGQKCETLLLYIKHFHWRISKSRLDSIFSLCGGGLLCEDYASHLVWTHHKNTINGQTHHLVDAILKNSVDIYSTYCDIKDLYQFPEDHWAHAAALNARLGGRRGFLLPGRIPSPFIFPGSPNSLPTITEARGIAHTGLFVYTNYFFKAAFNPELSQLMAGTFRDIKRYSMLCLRLRLSLKGWSKLMERLAEKYGINLEKKRFIEKVFGKQLSRVSANELTSKEAVRAIGNMWQ